MKSTKNLLMIGIVLAITLCSSVQVVAMEPGRKTNPYLTTVERAAIETRIQGYANEIENRRKRSLNLPVDNYMIAFHQAYLNAYKAILYGNKSYDDSYNDLQKMIDNDPGLQKATEAQLAAEKKYRR